MQSIQRTTGEREIQREREREELSQQQRERSSSLLRDIICDEIRRKKFKKNGLFFELDFFLYSLNIYSRFGDDIK